MSSNPPVSMATTMRSKVMPRSDASNSFFSAFQRNGFTGSSYADVCLLSPPTQDAERVSSSGLLGRTIGGKREEGKFQTLASRHGSPECHSLGVVPEDQQMALRAACRSLLAKPCLLAMDATTKW